MNFPKVEEAANQSALAVLGAFHATENDKAPQGCKTLVLLGPQEPGFWHEVTASPEFSGPDPVDQWSMRVVGGLADALGATAVFPFGGPPYQPFIRWALRTGRVWSSPVGLLVHDKAGLFVSFRGALAFRETLELPENSAPSPCLSCPDQPCRTLCPVNALTADGYNVETCHEWLDTDQGAPCMTGGCLARRACPVSQSYGRLAEQSAHHMRAFHRGNT